MTRLTKSFVLVFALGLLAGCEPAPSTTLAPDKPAPDASKMTPEAMDQLLKENHAKDRS